jgi:hypothetical protein
MDMVGKFIAKVVEVDEDIEQMRRIRVSFPHLAKEDVKSMYAYPCDTMREWLPKLNDFVWVEWEMGVLNGRLIYTGRAYKKSDISDKFKENYSHEQMVDKDYNGNYIIWHNLGLTIIDKNGTQIDIDDEGINIAEAVNGHSIVLNADGIKATDGVNANTVTFDSAGIKLDCTNGNTVEMKSGKVDINGNFEVLQ